jgi:MoaA/NifB/PqqE/SkfB family radical SAM enzyme
MAIRALAATDHPLLAHIIPMRRCNLACTYCNEFDDFSKPVPIDEKYRRIDKMGSLGTANVTISGGELLMRVDCSSLRRPDERRGRRVADRHPDEHATCYVVQGRGLVVRGWNGCRFPSTT